MGHCDGGKSSFGLLNTAKIYAELGLKEGMTFLDAGCGPGDYALAASERVGDKGTVYALDRWEEGITALQERVSQRGIRNVRAAVADFPQGIPLENGSVDRCLLCCVLHGLVENKHAEGALTEIARVLKTDGRLAVVEFDKVEGGPGPPLRVRLSPEDTDRIVSPCGFVKEWETEIGPSVYMILFAFGRPKAGGGWGSARTPTLGSQESE